MGQLSIVKNGVEVKLPHGFRFCPTDEELVLHYLRRKVFSVPLPASIIPELEVFNSDPWDLPGDSEEERYFFSSKSSNRGTKSGYWKSTGVDNPVFTIIRRPLPPQLVVVGMKRPLVVAPPPPPLQVVVGMKKTLVFYQGKSPNGIRTDWIMQEYHLASLQSLFLTGNAPLPNHLTQENWVICRINKKKNGGNGNNDEPEQELESELEVNGKAVKKSKRGDDGETRQVVFHNFIGKKNNNRLDLNEQPVVVSQSSSGITEISCDSVDSDDDDDDEEEENCSSCSSCEAASS